MNTLTEALTAVKRAWAAFAPECLSVLGSELHYQAMFYHHLRTSGSVPLSQAGMNVKMWIENPVSPLFQALSSHKHADYQGGFEPIPNIVIFKPEIASDWRRRNYANTLRQMLVQ